MSIHCFFFIATYLTWLYTLERWRWLLSKMLSLTRSNEEFSASLFLCLPVYVKIVCGITVEHVTPVTADLHWSQCSQTSLVLTRSINMWFRGSSQHIFMSLECLLIFCRKQLLCKQQVTAPVCCKRWTLLLLHERLSVHGEWAVPGCQWGHDAGLQSDQ